VQVKNKKQLENAMARVRRKYVAQHVYLLKDSKQLLRFTDSIFVEFKTEPADEIVSAFAQKYGLVVQTRMLSVIVFKITNNTGMNPVKFVRALNEDMPNGVKRVEHSFFYNIKVI